MIRIGVLSDSHGMMNLLYDAVDEMKHCDVIVHLGDHAGDAKEISARTGKTTWIVSGNCDWFSDYDNGRILEYEGVRVYITHGHSESVKSGLTKLSLKAEALEAGLVLYGHTHKPCVEQDGRCMFINPGAIRDGRYAIVEIDSGNIRSNLKKL